MEIKNGFILAAGKGTRMGEVGTKLPKLLWPLFEYSALELQTLYLFDWGCRKIYINLFSHAEDILEHISSSPIIQSLQSEGLEVIAYKEPELLGTGGALQFLKKQFQLNGPLLVNNGDQFFLCSKEEKKKFIEAFGQKDLLLSLVEISKTHKYGGLELNAKKQMIGIIPNRDITTCTHQTFSGLRILNMDNIQPREQFANFFHDLYPLEPPIETHKIEGHYFDLGTLERYRDLISDLYEDPSSEFSKWLLKNQAIESSKIDYKKMSYASNMSRCLNFSGKKIQDKEKTIFFKEDLSISF